MAAKKVHGTSRGVPIDDNAIDALAAEAEPGTTQRFYDVEVAVRRWDPDQPKWCRSAWTLI